MRILHLSDTHLERADAPNAAGVNATEVLRGLLADLRHVRGIDTIVVSGDIADDGSAEAYTMARELIGEFARRVEAPVFFSTGNHDERAAFTRVLGSGHRDPGGDDRADDVVDTPDAERAAAGMFGGFRIITLDSLVPGKGYGLIGRTQLDWLRDKISVPTRCGTVLIFHHPPIMMDDPVQRALALQNPAELAAAIRGSDVRLILCGHFHLQLSGLLEPATVWVTPAVVNRIDMTAPANILRIVRGASATLIDIGTRAAPMFHTVHARDPRAGQTVTEIGGEQLDAAIRKLGPGD